jgi:G3E family GTPase
MSLPDLRDVPTHLICGFLGVGKTTAILDLFRHRPAGERWAVLVNELGEVGIDGETLAEGGYAVREIAGGCICCASGPQLQVHLVRLLREERPDRLFIEPTGLAMPGTILDMLRRPGFREALAVRAVITIVDPVRFGQRRYRELDAYAAQLQAADVLVANQCDVAPHEAVQTFLDEAAAMWPPKVEVATTSQGRLDPRWLDLDPVPREVAHDHHHTDEVEQRGWVYPIDRVWDRARLQAALQELVRPGPLLPDGVLRLKGVFRTPGAWLMVQATEDRVAFHPVQHRRDSRLEVLVRAGSGPDWAAVEAAVEAARWQPEL